MQCISKQIGLELPPLEKNQTRTILARDGVYVERDTELFTCSVKGETSLPMLEPHKEAVRLKTPPLTAEFMAVGLGFLKKAYDSHGGEAALMLLYYPAEKRWEWYCPDQWVEGVRKGEEVYAAVGMEVHFEHPLDLPLTHPGAVIFGDLHSHPTFSPFPSWTDKDDEKHKDGLHMIAGYITGKARERWIDGEWVKRPQVPEINADFVMNQGRIHLDEKKLITGEIPSSSEWPEPPKAWMDKIEVKVPKKGWTYRYGKENTEEDYETYQFHQLYGDVY